MRNVQVAWMPAFTSAAFLGVILLSSGGCANQQANVQKLRAGYDALNARQLDAAMLAADEVLAASPQQTLPAEAHYLKGRVFEERAITIPSSTAANFQKARTEYIAALGLQHTPDLEGRIRADTANVAFHQDDYATAMAQWSAAYGALEKSEDKVLTLYRLGCTAQRLGRWDEADQYFAAVQQAVGGSDLGKRAAEKKGARGFVVQLATFAEAKQADAVVTDLRKQNLSAQHLVDQANGGVHLVRVGTYGSYAQAKSVKDRFAGVYSSAMILP
jgi:tetratricopeptide (TPR) repeat protein